MSVKKEVLSRLEQRRGEDVSGEALARELGVSRSAVWKAINALKQGGYPIEAVTNRGYRLSEAADILSAEGIRPHLAGEAAAALLEVHEELDSTNMEAKRRALARQGRPAIIIADRQTMGRGRFGRSFYSPPGCGIYMSILLYPTREQLSQAVMLTTAAAVAVCRAISGLGGAEPQIKWVNDIYLRGKKVCGILTEAVSDMESGAIESVVVGIGINFKSGGPLPDEIAGIAGAVFDGAAPISRNLAAARVANCFFDIFGGLSKREFLDEYRRRSMLLGEEIVYFRGDKKYAATAESIDDDGALVVVFADGRREALRSGEVSVRPGAGQAAPPFAGGSV